MNYKELFETFQNNADSGKSSGMKAYMKNQFEFLGISASNRRLLSKDFLKTAQKDTKPNWKFIFECWSKTEREFQYLAIDYLYAVKDTLTPDDIPKIKQIASSKSWWDTIDSLDRLTGHIALKHPEVNQTLLDWSLDENYWLRRIAIDHQLLRKNKTDTGLLKQIIENNLGQKEFFINKAIGWSLRDYSKTDPKWVRAFVDEYRDRLAPLSLREASKYI